MLDVLFSSSPAAIFKANFFLKNGGLAGEWQLRPFPCSPHSISLRGASQPRITEPACCLISEMFNSLWAMWDSLKRVIKVLCLSKLKSLKGMRMKLDVVKSAKGSVLEKGLSSHLETGQEESEKPTGQGNSTSPSADVKPLSAKL